jgi:glycerol-3-phosphate dehydrogenase
VKYTTARGVAAEAIDVVMRRLGRRADCRTDQVPLPGGDATDLDELQKELQQRWVAGIDPEVARHLAETYGSEARQLVAMAASTRRLGERVAPGVPVIRAQVAHAVRNEMACTLTDLVARRTPIGAAGHPGRRAAEGFAAAMAEELVWSQARVEQEEAALEAFYAPARAGLDSSTSP